MQIKTCATLYATHEQQKLISFKQTKVSMNIIPQFMLGASITINKFW